MTIGIIANTYPPNLNGVSITTARLVESLQDKGVKVVVAVPKTRGVVYPDYVLALKSIPLPKRIRSDIQVPYLWKDEVYAFFKQKKVDIIHSHDTFFGGLEASQIAQALDVPSVHTYHTYIEAYKSIDIPGYKPFIRQFSRVVCNNYDHIIALSSKIKRYLQNLDIKTEISQFLNVSNLSHLKLEHFDTKFAKRHGIGPRDFVIITFGRLSKEKGLLEALRVVEPLLKSHRDIKYVIVGQGSFIKKISQKAKQIGISDQVILPGKYTPQNLGKWCGLAKFFLFTSRSDNLPTTLLEAMWCGLPVVSVDDESVDYILKDGLNGFKGSLNKLSYFCGDLYSNPKLLQKMSEQAILSAKKIDSRDTTQEYLDLYQAVIKKYKNKPKKLNLIERYISDLIDYYDTKQGE